jgi:MFS family permease
LSAKEVSNIIKYFQSYFYQYRDLPRSIYFIFLSRIINCIGAFVGPLMTLLLTDRIGLSTAQAGMFVTVSTSLTVPAAILGGYLSDRFKRKNTLCILTLIQAFCYLACGFMEMSMKIPILLLTASFFSSAAQPSSSAMTADLSDKRTRQGAFSILYLGTNIGFSVGPLIAGFLYKSFLPLLFIGDALTTIISVIIIFVNVPETKPAYDIEEEFLSDDSEHAEEGSSISALMKRPKLLAFGIISIFISFINSQVHFSLPLFTNQIFGSGTGATIFGTLMSANGITVVFMTIFIIGSTRKFDSAFNVSMSAVFWALGLGMLYFVSSFPLMILSTIIWTIGEILNVTNVGVYIANNSPKSHRARFNSLYTIISGSGQAIGPYIMGTYLKTNPIKNVWAISFFMGIICAAIMYCFYIYESTESLRKLRTQKR